MFNDLQIRFYIAVQIEIGGRLGKRWKPNGLSQRAHKVEKVEIERDFGAFQIGTVAIFSSKNATRERTTRGDDSSADRAIGSAERDRCLRSPRFRCRCDTERSVD